ncbi:MAG TPA: choice-of-anchor P family protein [Actinomycetota bacterium]|nr:choice-of-anchor P family protein [Actinomycetota bacterium]
MKRKLTAGAVATMAAALVLGPFLASPASADLQSFQARSESHALRIIVDLSGLPAEVKGNLNTAWASVPEAAKNQLGLPVAQFPFVIDQYFVRTSSDASSSLTKALSVLGSVGETPGAWGKDLGSVSADAVGQSNSNTTQAFSLPGDQIPSVGLDLVRGTVGQLTASVSTGPSVVGDASLASVSSSLADIAAMAPELKEVIDTVLGVVNGSVTDANETIAGAADELSAVLAPVVAGTPLEPVVTDAEALVDTISLPAIPNPLGDGITMAEIRGVAATTTAQKGASLSSADSQSTIKAVDVLDGFLSAGLIDLSAHSEAAGKAGTARNAAACTIADLRVGGENGIALDGTHVYLNGEAVQVPGADQVAFLKSQVDSVLADAGVTVDLCDTSRSTAAADGSSASQQVSAFIATIEPRVPSGANLAGTPFAGLLPGQSLGVRIVVDPTVSTAVGAAPAALAAPAQLPRTGAPAVATMISGAALAAGALTLRRRVR